MKDSRLCLALDVPTGAQAIEWVERTQHIFGVYKIGLELFCAEGRQVIDAVKAAGAESVFLDLKLHDIPRTVGRAVGRLADLGVDYLTIHTSGGGDMMAAAAEAAESRITLLGVTVLTSLDRSALSDVGVTGTAEDAVSQRARLALNSGLRGLVCSAQEAARLREELGSTAYLVTPGIRLPGGDIGDQKRVMTPARAIHSGADLLVIGRAVTASENPTQAINALLENLNG